MIGVDSWIWLEFFFRGPKQAAAERVLERLKEEGGVISTMALAEIRFHIARKFGLQHADEALHFVANIPNLTILPLVTDAARLAAGLRLKYYSVKRPLSFADATHIATAVLAGCSMFHSGDPDFRGIEEIRTVVV
jgi:predicted nucleic acid-binding protein